MRFMTTTIALCLVALGVPAAEPPAITMHTKPIASIVDDARAGAKLVGGDQVLNQLNAFLNQDSSKQVLESLNTQRSIAMYINLTGKEDTNSKLPLVMVVPIADQKKFIQLMNDGSVKWQPVKGDDGLYKSEIAATDDQPLSMGYARFVDGFAYMVTEGDATLVSKESLVPYEKLIDPQETALFAARVKFARLPEEVRVKAKEILEQSIQELKNAPLPPEATASVKQITELSQKAMTKIMTQLKDADEATFRVRFDRKSGDLSVEGGLTGTPGSSLAKEIAARGETKNLFAGLVTPQTVIGLLGSAPRFNQDLGKMMALAIDNALKEQKESVPPPAQPLVEQLLGGISRTLSISELDFGVVLNGPDKAGHYSALLGLSFEDTSGLEKEIKKLVKEAAPPEYADLIKLDAATVGKSNIHVIALPPGVLPAPASGLFGEKAAIGLAFTPKSILVTLSSDPVATLKPLVALEPKPSRTVDLVINPVGAAKLASSIDPQVGAQVKEFLGEKDSPYSIVFMDLNGGKELNVKLGFNIRIFGQIAMIGAMYPEAPQPKK